MKNFIQTADMKNDIERIMKFFTHQPMKTLILTFLLAFSIIGNHMYATTFAESNTDSNITSALSNTTLIGDDLRNTKISMPSTRSFYRADREINRNMANEIKKLYQFRFELPAFTDADQNINYSFYDEFKIQHIYALDPSFDEQMRNEFLAFNLNNNITKNTLLSDNEINRSFESSYFISCTGNVSQADFSINADFELENN